MSVAWVTCPRPPESCVALKGRASIRVSKPVIVQNDAKAIDVSKLSYFTVPTPYYFVTYSPFTELADLIFVV